MLNELRKLNGGPLSHEAVLRIFRQIIDEARRLEQEQERQASTERARPQANPEE